MSPRRTETERLHDLLDGLLPPAEEAELRRTLLESPALASELESLAAVTSLLDTSLDVDPPADLLPSVLRAVRAEQAAPAPKRLPGWLENLLVGVGAFAVAAVVAAGRVVGPEWIGRAVVEGARGFGLAKTAALDLIQWDWTLRLLGTLGRASGTVLGSSAGALLGLALVALVVSALFGFVLLRGGRVFRAGGLGHAHVLA